MGAEFANGVVVVVFLVLLLLAFVVIGTMAGHGRVGETEVVVVGVAVGGAGWTYVVVGVGVVVIVGAVVILDGGNESCVGFGFCLYLMSVLTGSLDTALLTLLLQPGTT